MPDLLVDPKDDHRLTVVACFATMFMVGVTISLLGPSLPGLAAATGLSLAQAGVFFTLFSGGSVLSTLVVARFMDRPARHVLVLAGALIMAGAQWLVASSGSLAWASVAVALTGLAMSTAGTVPNALIVGLYRERAPQALNALHLCLGVGAFVGPLLVGVATRLGNDYTAVYRLAGTVMLLIGGLWSFARPPQPERADPADRASAFGILLPLVTLFLFAILYTGTEQAFGGWIFTYAQRMIAADATQASLFTSLFWLAILLGRLAATRGIYRRLSSLGLLAIGVLLGALGLALVLVGSQNPPLLWIGVGLIGFGFGPVFPTALALSGQRVPGRAGMASSLLVAAGSVGAMTLPWASGALMAQAGMVGGMAALLAPLAAMLACLWIIKAARRSD